MGDIYARVQGILDWFQHILGPISIYGYLVRLSLVFTSLLDISYLALSKNCMSARSISPSVKCLPYIYNTSDVLVLCRMIQQRQSSLATVRWEKMEWLVSLMMTLRRESRTSLVMSFGPSTSSSPSLSSSVFSVLEWSTPTIGSSERQMSNGNSSGCKRKSIVKRFLLKIVPFQGKFVVEIS